MIKVPLTGGPCALDGKNLRWAWCGRATVQAFSWAESHSVVTQVGAQFTDLSETEKRLVPQLGYWYEIYIYMERQRCYYSKSFGCKVLPFSNHHLRVLEVALLNEVWRKPCFHHRRILAAGLLKRRGIGLSTLSLGTRDCWQVVVLPAGIAVDDTPSNDAPATLDFARRVKTTGGQGKITLLINFFKNFPHQFARTFFPIPQIIKKNNQKKILPHSSASILSFKACLRVRLGCGTARLSSEASEGWRIGRLPCQMGQDLVHE